MTATATATAIATASAATAERAETRTRTGGPEDGSKILEHVLGWTLVVVLAMLVTQAGLL
ncbi:SCO1431 family membrane protein [Streptomyces sp. NBC_01142]|uniref:SCO1431 family membrane protein n=1 Tax=Streptomyces sp. NBC_01142 TaxID=2975865 RepID=UPI0022541EF7|nr:SCO1431 family membrane protein [Streptomyces sp. NBC_01142]MCX4821690.1 SCO1431 family membrane protein [Streptomyces sp. NBC_01142]